MTAYQHSATKTIQPLPGGGDPVVTALLGLAGEAGAVLTGYKKQLRDGPADPEFRARMREELGDVLWYLAAVAHHLDLDLGDVATANLSKITDRWRPTPATAIPFDTDLEPNEQLPRHADFVFTLTREDERDVSVLSWDGRQVGDPITNASHIADGYNFHDIFHLSYVAVLGWSPVMRSLLNRKRRSNRQTDEAEDGGRAIAIEEGISALVFGYASRHQYLDGKYHVDNDVLDTIQGMVAHLEVGAHRTADWEKAILTGFAAWRALRRLGGGTVRLNMDTQSLSVIGTGPEPTGADASAMDTFRSSIVNLHRNKDAAYGDSWKRRGEQISIMANIARKVDRLSITAATGYTVDENAIDTAVDLYVYALKYVTYLADIDATVLPEPNAQLSGASNWSDGPDGFERLVASADLTALEGNGAPIPDLILALEQTFAQLESCFTVDVEPASAARRALFAFDLAAHGLRIISALRASHPGMYRQFLETWHG